MKEVLRDSRWLTGFLHYLESGLIGRSQKMTGECDVRAVVRMAEELSIETTAEGIETPEQLEELLTLECGTGRGYLLGCPMEASFARTLAFNERNTSAHAYRLIARSGRLPATPQAV